MKTIGVLGGGQLARMLALAGYPYGFRLICYDPAPDACAAQVTQVIRGDFHDEAALLRFAEQVELVTFETENIPLQSAGIIAQRASLLPGLKALQITQDRLLEKNFLREMDIPVASYCAIAQEEITPTALAAFSFPAVLKTRRAGYDGKGQMMIHNEEELHAGIRQLQQPDLILEAFVPFSQEASLVCVRSITGEMKFYPLTVNQHHKGILRVSCAPQKNLSLQKSAESHAVRIMQALDYVGVMTIEFFIHEGQLMVNEIAPRVHNSGHWTIEGAVTSQFENHLRAITGMPPGATTSSGYSFMLNLIGNIASTNAILKIPHTHLHTYGKAPRAGRKLGHITVNHADFQQAQMLAKQVQELISISPGQHEDAQVDLFHVHTGPDFI